MDRKEAEDILKDHYITVDVSECDLCGQHTNVNCSCGYFAEYGHATDSIQHVLDVLFPKNE